MFDSIWYIGGLAFLIVGGFVGFVMAIVLLSPIIHPAVTGFCLLFLMYLIYRVYKHLRGE